MHSSPHDLLTMVQKPTSCLMRKQQKELLNGRCCFMWALQVVRAPRSVAMQAELTVMPNLRWTVIYTLQHEA